MNRIFTIVFMCLGIHSALLAQTTVSGRVISSEDGEGLPGVSVVIKGTTRGTATDVSGNFSLQASPEDILVFSFTGMTTEEIQVNNQTVINLTMTPDIQQLQEVVVVGYGTQKREDITSSISTIDEDEIANVPAAYSFDAAVQGRSTGLNISTSSATPGSAVNINIRGVTSISASSQPLFVVDGIPLVSRNNSALNSNIQPINPLADINPNNIESVTILKDATAAAIYGSRGANGVIIITTKRGTAGKTKFNVGYYTGVSEIANTPDLMNSSEWIRFMNTAAEYDGLGENYWNETLGDPDDPNLPNYNAYDYIFRTGITHNADLSIQGGDEKTKFFISGNYYDQEGIQVGLGFERLSTQLNLDHSVNDKLGIGANILLSKTDHERTINENDEYGVVINAQAWDPTAPLIEEDGSYSNPFSYNGWWALENPLFIAEQYVNNSSTKRALGSVFATYDFTENLSFKTTWSIDFNSLTDESFIPAGGNQTDEGQGIYGTYEELSWLIENTLSYNKLVGEDHNFNLLAGYTIQESQTEFSDIVGTGFPSNNIIKLSTAANTTGSSGATSYGFQSFLARLNYDYQGKYLFNFTVRADGSSRFGPNERYGVFPSGSVGWMVSKEAFMENVRSVSNLKLRASYGQVGNAAIPNFLWRGAYSLGASYGGLGGSQPSVLENRDLTWERTTQLDLGIDLGLFEDRVSLTADYFEKTTTDLLLSRDVPGVTGFRSVQSNVGEIENTGYEFSLSTLNIDREDFSWRTSFNYSHIENEVVDVVNNGEVVSRNFIILEGKPISQLYLIEYLGVDPFTGDATFEDLNGDGIINLDDRQAVGSGLPTFFGGLSNTFQWKGFTLDIFFQYSGGNKIFNQSRFAYENYGAIRSGIPYGNQSTNSFNHWKEPGDITDVPRPSLASEDDPNAELQFQRFSTQYLEDGDYLRLKNVRVAYQLPFEVTERLNLGTVTFFVQGRNLYTWTDYLGFDPEVSTNTSSQGDLNALQGEDFGTLGQARTYSIGVNIGF